MERIQELGDGEGCCEMLSSGQGTAATIKNSQQVQLLEQDLHKNQATPAYKDQMMELQAPPITGATGTGQLLGQKELFFLEDMTSTNWTVSYQKKKKKTKTHEVKMYFGDGHGRSQWKMGVS